MAMRGHASIQGSSDIPTLFDTLPGYIPAPHAHAPPDLDAFIEGNAPRQGFWGNMRDYTVSLLKAWWGAAATADNDFCFDYLPRLTGNHGTYDTVMAQIAGTVEGYFLFGQNPAVGSANSRMQRLGMSKLEMAGRPRLLADRIRDLVEGRPGDRVRRDAHRGARDRGVLLPGRRPHREGRHVHQHPADGPVAPQGGRAAARAALGPVVRLPPRTADPPAAGRLRRRGRPAGARAHLGLPHRGRARRAQRRGGAGRDQRL